MNFLVQTDLSESAQNGMTGARPSGRFNVRKDESHEFSNAPAPATLKRRERRAPRTGLVRG
jgi:hypothetical protein